MMAKNKINEREKKWDSRFVELAKMVATWSTCIRRQVGAVIVKDHRVLAIGYNGAPEGVQNCIERGECLRNKLGIESGTRREICYSVCAEQNAIAQAARMGHNIMGSTIYCTLTPCSTCAKLMINAGIKRVVCLDNYPDEFSINLLKEAGVELEKFQ